MDLSNSDIGDRNAYSQFIVCNLQQSSDLFSIFISSSINTFSSTSNGQQSFYFIAACITTFLAGAWISWASVCLKKLSDTEPDLEQIGFRLTKYEISWMTSLLDLGNITSPVLGCLVMYKIGRKYSLLLASLIFCIPISFLVYQDVMSLYISRFSVGFAKGLALIALHLYLSEIADRKIRGTLIALSSTHMFAGFLTVLFIGPYISMRVLTIALCAIPFMFMLIFSFVPESPYHLAAVNKIKEAEHSLQWFRGTDNVDEELEAIVRKAKADMEDSSSFVQLFSSPSNRKALFIVFVTSFLQRLGGITSLGVYGPKTFPETNISLLNPVNSSTILMVSVLTSALTQYSLADIIGRKKLLAFSSCMDGIALCLIGVYFFFPSSDYSYLVYMCLVMYGFSYSGVGSVPSILVGELFPMNIRCQASSISGVCIAAGSFLTNKFHLLLVTFTNTGVVFFIYATFNFLMFLFTLTCVFETKCKTFEEIQDILEKSVEKKECVNEIQKAENGKSRY